MSSRYRGWGYVALAIGTIAPLPLLWWSGNRHTESMASLQKEVSELRAASQSAATGAPESRIAEQVGHLRRAVEDGERRSVRLERLHKIAAGNGVRIVKAAYLQPDPAPGDDGIRRYDMRCEAEARYFALRFFLRDLLAADPLLSLASIELRRATGGSYNAGKETVLANLHIVMYYREAQ